MSLLGEKLSAELEKCFKCKECENTIKDDMFEECEICGSIFCCECTTVELALHRFNNENDKYVCCKECIRREV